MVRTEANFVVARLAPLRKCADIFKSRNLRADVRNQKRKHPRILKGLFSALIILRVLNRKSVHSFVCAFLS
jgi:hypothetical protein